MAVTLNPELLLLLTLGMGIGGLVKGASGVGLPMVSVPLLVAFIGVPDALALTTIPLLVTNAWQTWRFREQRAGTAFLIPLVLAGVCGILAGTLILTTLRPHYLSAVLVLLIVAYVGLQLTHPRFVMPPASALLWSPVVGFVAGALQTSTGISGPLSITFIHALRMKREKFVFAVSAMFFVFTAAQLPAFLAAGVMTPTLLVASCFAVLPTLAAMPLGSWLGSKLSQQTFDRLILVVLVCMAGKLLSGLIAGP